MIKDYVFDGQGVFSDFSGRLCKRVGDRVYRFCDARWIDDKSLIEEKKRKRRQKAEEIKWAAEAVAQVIADALQEVYDKEAAKNRPRIVKYRKQKRNAVLKLHSKSIRDEREEYHINCEELNKQQKKDVKDLMEIRIT